MKNANGFEIINIQEDNQRTLFLDIFFAQHNLSSKITYSKLEKILNRAPKKNYSLEELNYWLTKKWIEDSAY